MIPVLILVVVDNGLVRTRNVLELYLAAVLILVVVDNGLVLKNFEKSSIARFGVLILVVVDNGLVLSCN